METEGGKEGRWGNEDVEGEKKAEGGHEGRRREK